MEVDTSGILEEDAYSPSWPNGLIHIIIIPFRAAVGLVFAVSVLSGGCSASSCLAQLEQLLQRHSPSTHVRPILMHTQYFFEHPRRQLQPCATFSCKPSWEAVPIREKLTRPDGWSMEKDATLGGRGIGPPRPYGLVRRTVLI
jgi:hypothetical protein